SLAEYTAGRPYSLVAQRGDGHVAFLEKVVGLFAQDEIRVRPNLSLDIGLRYDWQNYFHDDDNFAPRASFAYAPGESGKTVDLVGSKGISMFRSRDVNAPPPPDFAARPDPGNGVVRQIESAGTLDAVSMQVTLRGQVTRFFNGSAEYSFGRAYNDTSGVGWMPPNSYDLSSEYARADFNQRHRFEAFGTLTPGAGVTIGVSASLGSGRPYSLTTGLDRFNTGTANARPPGVPRNSLEGPGFADLDLRAAREFTLPAAPGRKHSFTLGADAFNVLNHVNYSYFV